MWTGLEKLRAVEERMMEINAEGEPWYFVRIKFEKEKRLPDPADLLRRLGPELSLRRLGPDRFVVEGHTSHLEAGCLLELAGDALTGATRDGAVISITVEPHDYELLDLPVLYLEA